MPSSRSAIHSIASAQAMIATLAGTLSYHANADIYSHYIDEHTHGYIVENMPDFDQRRAFLPNTGDCYCGPAAAADLMGYISTHGFPDVEPGPPVTSWADLADYADLSRLLLDLGTGITSPGPRPDPCGTGIRDLRELLSDRVTYRFIVDSEVFNRSDPASVPPRFEDLSQRLARDNAIGISLAAVYRGTPSDFWSVQWPGGDVAERLGGHYEAVNRALVGPTVRRIGLRNPWTNDSDSILNQSLFATRFFDVETTTLRLAGGNVPIDVFNDPYILTYDDDDDSMTPEVPVDLLDHDDDPATPPIVQERIYAFEGYITLTPRWFLTWGEFSGAVERFSALPEFEAPDALRDKLDHAHPVSNVVIGPKSRSIITTGQGNLYRTIRGVDPTPQPVALPPNTPVTGDVAFDDTGRLHIVSFDRLVTLDPTSGEILGIAPLPGEGSSIAVQFGLVHVLVPEMEIVAVFDPEIRAIVDEFPLPDDAIVGAGSQIAMLPNGIFMLLTDGVLNPMRITPQGFARLWMPVPRDGEWDEMSVDVDDMMLLRDDQGLVEAYRATPKGFERLSGHAFDGLQVSGRIALPPSSPELPNLPEIATYDERSDVEIVPDCKGDLDFNGKTDAADLGILLSEWGAEHSRADFDRNGRVDSADLGLLLGFFGDCN